MAYFFETNGGRLDRKTAEVAAPRDRLDHSDKGGAHRPCRHRSKQPDWRERRSVKMVRRTRYNLAGSNEPALTPWPLTELRRGRHARASRVRNTR
jgi:hypothetical protein